ncbi:MAG TPA: GNAT family N-acetyltransferase [Acidimicrobiales bacterium]|nr:GNAT family N-acetyltransferase [Acidimicrobiales bacterium]
MAVRVVRPEEYQALAALTVAAYRALLGDDMDSGYAAELADVAGRAALVDVLVEADDDGRVLGGVTYIPGPGPMAWFTGAGDAGMRMLAVDPAAQGRGTGARLVAACVDRAVAAGKRRLLLHTTAPMVVAHRLYRRAGFRRDPAHDHELEGGVFLLAYVLDLGGSVVGTRPGGGTG